MFIIFKNIYIFLKFIFQKSFNTPLFIQSNIFIYLFISFFLYFYYLIFKNKYKLINISYL